VIVVRATIRLRPTANRRTIMAMLAGIAPDQRDIANKDKR
jgi:hypothetical protein